MLRLEPASRAAGFLLVAALFLDCDSRLNHLGAGRGVPGTGGADAGPDLPTSDSGGIEVPGPDMASADTAPACQQHGAVAANEVVWIGDGWLTTGVQVTTSVRDMARATGAIGPNDDYVDLAGNGATMSMIANQYNMAASRAPKPKVLIMDGGTVETMNDTSAATVRTATSTFTQLLARIAADGTVSDLIYILVPELPQVAAAVTAIRPSFQQACAQSAVKCRFIDLQPIWAEGGGHPEYTASNGILPTTTGARATATEIWRTMMSNCIAQ